MKRAQARKRGWIDDHAWAAPLTRPARDLAFDQSAVSGEEKSVGDYGTLAASGESHDVKFFALSEFPAEEEISTPLRPVLRDIKQWMQTDQKRT